MLRHDLPDPPLGWGTGKVFDDAVDAPGTPGVVAGADQVSALAVPATG